MDGGRLEADEEERTIESSDRTKTNYTGNVNICMDCDAFTTLEGGAAYHSKENKHQVIQTIMRDEPITKESIQELREGLRKLRVDR